MTFEERKRMFALSKLIQDEKDPKKIADLIQELNKLLDQQSERIQSEDTSMTA